MNAMNAKNPIALTRQQVRQIDRRAVDECGMSSLVLMENAGRGCADVLCRSGIVGPVVVCCFKGNNAGDGFVIARHLDLRGKAVEVMLWARPEELQGDAAANFGILAHTDVAVSVMLDPAVSRAAAQRIAQTGWIVDALLGTGAQGSPRPPLDAAIEQMNESPARKLAVDVPSGLDCDTGQPAKPTFRADVTCTFVAAKTGFAAKSAREYLGQVHVLDIGAPRKLIEQVAAAR